MNKIPSNPVAFTGIAIVSAPNNSKKEKVFWRFASEIGMKRNYSFEELRESRDYFFQ